MGRHYITVFAVVAAVTTIVNGQGNVSACFNDQNTQQTGELGIEQFGITLFRELAENTDKSIFISPYSIWSAFLYAYFGSGGRTQQQLAYVLGVEGKTSTFHRFQQLQFLLENSFIEDGAVVTTLKKAYFDQVIPLKKCISELIQSKLINFQKPVNATEIINQEAYSATQGKINNLVKPGMLHGAKFLLLNAGYFQGVWEIPFDKRLISRVYFRDALGNDIVQLELMTSTRDEALISRAPVLGAEILELPYANSNISMFLILPDADKNVNTVLRKLTPYNFQKSLENTESTRALIGVPKFKMETTLIDDLKLAMGRLGVVDLFTYQGNLTSFSHEPLRADSVVHKAVVEVSEEGTVVAAETPIIGTRSGGRMKPIIFNRPFIFLIHDKKYRITLFSGVFRHPDDATG